MTRHYTPDNVAELLSKHAPRELTSLLDPAVGSGVLIRPLLERCRKQSATVVCVDSDAEALAELRSTLDNKTAKQAQFVNADFLEWAASECSQPRHREFDCVVMNPPFSAQKSGYTWISSQAYCPGSSLRTRSVPVETAFVLRAVEMLRPGGRLLAILPGSIVMSESSQWLREHLLRVGAIHYVRELPRRTFREVESRFYLFIFQKTGRQRVITLCNHDLAGRERLYVAKSELGPSLRLDYGFHDSRQELQALVEAGGMEWQLLKECASLFRGTEKSPDGVDYSIHTCDYRNGFWRRASRHREPAAAGDTCVQKGDILVKRVSRNCSQSFGRGLGIIGMPCSDCVIVIRPNRQRSSSRLLFALRCLSTLEATRTKIESGTGAAYVTLNELLTLRVPIGIDRRFPRLFKTFCEALRRKNGRKLAAVERSAHRFLLKRGGSG